MDDLVIGLDFAKPDSVDKSMVFFRDGKEIILYGELNEITEKDMLEKQIEEKVCKYAKDKGLLVYKFTSPNKMAVPDRLFVTPSGKVFFIEFKREGAKPTEAQNREHERLRGHNVLVFVVDNVEQGKFVIDLNS